MKIVLYYAPNTCALAPYVTLTEAKAEFEARPVNMGKRQHFSPEYLKINPKHKVPVLEIDGKHLTENAAIHLWVHRNFPAAKLIPSDPWDELKAISLMSWCSSGIHPFLARINNPANVADNAAESVKAIAARQLAENYKVADDMLAGREWFFDHFTAPDAHFFWCVRRGTQFGLDFSPFKNVMAHFERMQQRPSVQKLLAFEKDVQAQFAKAA